MALDPELRKKLLKESKNPFKGIRRLIWIALFGSASIGLLIMSARFFSGEMVPLSDIGIQTIAFLLFGSLIYFDRSRTG